MSHRQHLHPGQLRAGQQGPLHIRAHVAGDQRVKVPLRCQDAQPLLVGLPRAQRGKQADRPLPVQFQGGVTADEPHLSACALRRGQKFLPDGALLVHIGEGQQPHLHPFQQAGHPVGVVVVEVGHHQQIQPPDAEIPQIAGHTVPRVLIAAPAAVHQGEEAAAAHQNTLPLAHIQGGDRSRPTPETPAAEHHSQTQGGYAAAH